MNPSESKPNPDSFDHQRPPVVGPSTSQWQQFANRRQRIAQDGPALTPKSRLPEATYLPEQKPPAKPNQRPTTRQYFRRRVGAAALAISLGVGGIAFGWPKLTQHIVQYMEDNPAYDVSGRTPTEEEICTIRRVGNRALLVIASEFTNDADSRVAGSGRIRQATLDQDDDRFAVCYSPANDYSRVLTDEAVENLPAERLVSWERFPGRTDR